MTVTLAREVVQRVARPADRFDWQTSRHDRFSYVVVAAFGIASVFKALVHELSDEEAQAWLIARASRTPVHLLANLRAEGHPPLWYLLLWPFAQLGDPLAMQIVSAMLATATAAIIVRRAPFPLIYRFLALSSYFLLFQFNTVARSYSLELLLLVAAVEAMTRVEVRARRVLLYLAMAALTSLYGAVVAAALFAGLLVIRSRGRAVPRRLPRSWVLALTASGAYCALQALFARNPTPGQRISDLARPGGGAPRALLDVFFPNTEMTWPDFFAFVHDNTVAYGLIVLVGFFVASLVAFRAPASAVVWVVGFTGTAALISITGFAAPHHRGHVALLAFLCVWIAFASPGNRVFGGRVGRVIDHRVVGAVLAIALTTNAAFGIAASARDIALPYTPFAEVSSYLEDQGLLDAVYFANWVPSTVSILALIDRPVRYGPRWDETRFARWDQQERSTPDATFAKAYAWHMRTATPSVLLLDVPLDSVPPGIETRVFYKGFHEPDAEQIWVYVIR